MYNTISENYNNQEILKSHLILYDKSRKRYDAISTLSAHLSENVWNDYDCDYDYVLPENFLSSGSIPAALHSWSLNKTIKPVFATKGSEVPPNNL